MRKLTTILLFIGLTINCLGQQKNNDKHGSKSRIFDHAYMLSEQQVDSLTILINDLEKNIGSQIAVWTQTSLDGQTIEKLSFEIANKYGFGRAQQNDGVLIFIAETDRQVRIEVGLGLENIIKDETAAQLLREDLIPNFKLNKYGLGLYLVIEKISKLITDNVELIGTKPQYLQRWDSLSNKKKN